MIDSVARAVDPPAVPGAAQRRLTARRRWELRASWLSPLAVLTLWEVCARTGIVDPRILPPPSVVVGAIISLSLHGPMLTDTGATIARFLVGMVLGTVPGLAVGLTMGIFRWPRIVLEPLVAAFYPLPRIAMFPLVLILVGLNETSDVILIALGPFFTMIITVMTGVLNVEPIYREVAASFNTKSKDLYLRVMFPAALPVIMGGLRVSLGLAFLSTIAVEFLVGSTGLGYLIWNSWQILSLVQSMAGLVAAGIIGFLFYTALAWLEKRVIPWKASSL